jgi:CheY-like chemotaxis protein
VVFAISAGRAFSGNKSRSTYKMQDTQVSCPEPFMTEKHKVLVVDDSEDYAHLMQVGLAKSFQVEVASSGAACLERVRVSVPDIILLDINMDEMDGFETCRALRAIPETSEVPVIFVSACEGIEERLQSYEAGGWDYLVKPVALKELRQKLSICLNWSKERHELSHRAAYAQSTAMTAMTSMGEIGAVLEFLKASFACNSYEDLAKTALDTMSQYGLVGSVQLRGASGVINRETDGQASELAISVLNHLSKMSRIFEFRDRMVVNYGHVTLLVNNMPLDDPDKCGRLRDHIAMLAEGADERVHALDVEHALRVREARLATALRDMHETLEWYEGRQREVKGKSIAIMRELVDEIEDSFVSLGLTQGQEDFLLARAKMAMEKSFATHDETKGMDHRLMQIIRQLDEFV